MQKNVNLFRVKKIVYFLQQCIFLRSWNMPTSYEPQIFITLSNFTKKGSHGSLKVYLMDDIYLDSA